jgi:hypothetical protein
MNREPTGVSRNEESSSGNLNSFKNSSFHGVNIFNFGNLTLGVSGLKEVVQQLARMDPSGDKEESPQEATVIRTKQPDYDSEY